MAWSISRSEVNADAGMSSDGTINQLGIPVGTHLYGIAAPEMKLASDKGVNKPKWTVVTASFAADYSPPRYERKSDPSTVAERSILGRES